jgi:phage tail sheath protein FI
VPVATTYPGVYVQEIPSGVRTITGVATSITAFIGRASRGPVNQAVIINSFGDFETTFGGLWLYSTLGFAVRDFFLNGGGQAVIVRLYHADAGSPQAEPPVPAPASKAPLTVGALKFVASSEGQWGVGLRVAVVNDKKETSAEVALLLGVKQDDLFNLTVTDTATGRSEKYLNLTVKDTAHRVDKVLASSSALLAYDGAVDPTTAIAAGKDALSVKEDALAAAKKALIDKQNGSPGADVSSEKGAEGGIRWHLPGRAGLLARPGPRAKAWPLCAGAGRPVQPAVHPTLSLARGYHRRGPEPGGQRSGLL